MHLLATTPGSITDGSKAVDLGQTPGDVVILSAADTELACLADAKAAVGGFELRLANLLRLGHPMSVDLYVEAVIRHARLVVVRLLGGRGYWPFGVEQIAAVCRQTGCPVAFLPGDDQPDADLAAWSSLPADACHRLWQYLVHGGRANAEQGLRYAASLIGIEQSWREPVPLPPAGLYPPGASLDALTADWTADAPTAAIVVYRALVQAGHTAALDALTAELRQRGFNCLPIFIASLKDRLSVATLEALLEARPPDVVLNTTGFSVAAPDHPKDGPFGPADCPVLQVIFSGGTETAWRDGTAGLAARDIAMNVALPEVDGRIITRAVSFKAAARRDDETQCDIVATRPVADRIAFVADLAAGWAKLRRKSEAERHIALVLANYPNRDGRIGNGVGLDTPAATVGVLGALAKAGYRVTDIPRDGNALITLLSQGATNNLAERARRVVRETLSLPDYLAFFQRLPASVQTAVGDRWGTPEEDPHFVPGELSCGHFVISALRFGNIAVGIQPARGYNIDPAATYHDPALVPPHGYLAFYAWLREGFGADAIVHMGKHGNLEWLPGKSLALSGGCFPEAALGPMPHLYPFIVNDPGEGTQAKRRSQAVIIDHLTPPLTRAESYGPLRQLEQLVDEYYEAASVDPRRLKVLKDEILALTRTSGLDVDCGIAPGDPAESALKKLDNHLCELKELQIRDGLHIFGQAPTGGQLTDLLVALARIPRGSAPEQASLLRALADDFALAFDPLDTPLGEPWTGPRPGVLAQQGDDPWRTAGDTVERLEILARILVADGKAAGMVKAWPRAAAVLGWIATALRPAVEACGDAEIQGLLKGLAGRFVPPGPSGAPTRGRPDVLPTGRNFYSVDSRAVPTPTAWTLGWKSAGLLVERHLQDHGAWPRAVAISAWGTSNMRTGGDDIAQALALIGARPTWDSASKRVTGFEVMPLSVLDRPRVDVTLRVSGFFRDAFPALIDLFDSAARAVAALDEGDDDNPLAAHLRDEAERLQSDGLSSEEAKRRAGFRVFGSKPGAYGAGLQALIDERGWSTSADLARAYVAWGGYAYGAGSAGAAEHGLFERRLRTAEAVIQNQDNREHDLLDSDDYYQFEGGMAAAVKTLSGVAPTVYHPDHSRPETPKIRTLEEEIARVVRARAANPKWLAGVMRHGYKGAFEMAATVDYLFAFAATTGCVKDHHFDALFDAYLRDETVHRFLAENNPAALAEMAARFEEAIDRRLWHPRRNDTHDLLKGSA
ncbi:cobaltochelatase subunit CobN [Telmatospirillum sp.]|uniref:cobaltochelatase subunit CobN n=1 Tax=Telmatospirillum sp. TaxID=2079197 RepID=UPI00283C60DC|nr:cobaltochelatase subunit CobN [Telmatospirillum sp.]MDR3437581.1 cobaltochelatase subunit CobN [Telmatospirillum sp.]